MGAAVLTRRSMRWRSEWRCMRSRSSADPDQAAESLATQPLHPPLRIPRARRTQQLLVVTPSTSSTHSSTVAARPSPDRLLSRCRSRFCRSSSGRSTPYEARQELTQLIRVCSLRGDSNWLSAASTGSAAAARAGSICITTGPIAALVSCRKRVSQTRKTMRVAMASRWVRQQVETPAVLEHDSRVRRRWRPVVLHDGMRWSFDQ
jgi:hypothetical protein